MAGMEVNEPTQDNSYYTDGRINIGEGYIFQAKVYDAPSKHGIEGGTISKLDVHKAGELVMRYDRGWVQEPQTPQEKEMIHRIRDGLGDKHQKPFKGFDRDANKDHGMDR
jgi:hypothetical protein